MPPSFIEMANIEDDCDCHVGKKDCLNEMIVLHKFHRKKEPLFSVLL